MSFHENTQELVNSVCMLEYSHATENWGETFSSLHEGWAVLKEDVEEADFNLSMVKSQAHGLWLAVKDGNSEWGETCLKAIQENAIECMMELAQVWAVCKKMNKTKKGVRNGQNGRNTSESTWESFGKQAGL